MLLSIGIQFEIYRFYNYLFLLPISVRQEFLSDENKHNFNFQGLKVGVGIEKTHNIRSQ